MLRDIDDYLPLARYRNENNVPREVGTWLNKKKGR